MIDRIFEKLRSLVRSAPRRSPAARLDKASLNALFERLGCDDPESWARSQIDEGINQLGRFLFIREAWAEAVPLNSTDWIDNVLGNCPPDAPLGDSWRRVLAAGADRGDMAQIVRAAQGEVIFGLCRLLDGPDQPVPEAHEFRWSLFEVDAGGRCVSPINFVHESVLELDPARSPQR